MRRELTRQEILAYADDLYDQAQMRRLRELDDRAEELKNDGLEKPAFILTWPVLGLAVIGGGLWILVWALLHGWCLR